MAFLERLLRTARACSSFYSFKTLNLQRGIPHRFHHRSFDKGIGSAAYEVPRSSFQFKNPHSHSAMFAFWFGSLLAAGSLELAYADADEAAVSAKPPLPSFNDLEGTARKERLRIEQMLRNKGMQYGSYPRFIVAVKGQKVTIKFEIPPACDVAQLIANLVSNLGMKVEEHGDGSNMSLHAWDSAVAWQLTLKHPEKKVGTEEGQGKSEEVTVQDGDLCILIFHSLISSDKAEIEFIKKGSLSDKELDAFVSVLQISGGKMVRKRPSESTTQNPSLEKSISDLHKMGVRVYGLDELRTNSANNEISWDNIAGYDQQKRDIEDTILLALHSPEVYDDIARGTRCKFESNRPRAVLFEGPPGTGKTSCARVIAKQAGVPLLYLPMEIIMSKYFGESERLLGKVFSLANELPDGALIFLDEVDSFATSRNSEMHEATRRILSVLLRQIDGFEEDKKVVVIAATNRKEDLDPALISRFESMIYFGLPDQQSRQKIAAQYAKHLTETEYVEFARLTEGMSGRDIRDVCQQAERQWASKIIRGQVSRDGEKGILPPLKEYMESTLQRKKALLNIEEQKGKEGPSSRSKPSQLDFL